MSRNTAYLLLIGSALFWSGNFILGRAFANDIPPMSLSYWRWTVALLVFLPFSLHRLYIDRQIILQHLGWIVFMGVFGVAGFNTFVYIGLNDTLATNALLINSFIPILIILLARVALGQSIHWLQTVGVVLSTAGVITLVARGDWQNLVDLQVRQGDLWILLAAFVWAAYSLGLRKRPEGLSSSAFLLSTMIVGVLVLSPLYWFNLLQEPVFEMSSNNIMAILYVALFASLGAFLCWNQGLRIVGARTGGQFIHLMPVFGMVMAVLFLGEKLFWFHVLGGVAIALGIFLSLKYARQ